MEPEWNGTMEWNDGMTTPTERALTTFIPTVFSTFNQEKAAAVAIKEDRLNLIQQRDWTREVWLSESG